MKWIRRLIFSWWIVAAVVVSVSLVGANKIRNGQRPESAAPKPARQPGENPPSKRAGIRKNAGVAPTGIVTPEKDIVPLHPIRGQVVELLVKNDDQVKRDQVLLRMDDTLARIELTRAEIGVEAAQAQLKKAKNGLPQWEAAKAAQVKMIEIRKKQYKTAYDLWVDLDKIAKDGARATDQLQAKIARARAEEAVLAVQTEESQLVIVETKKPMMDVRLAEIAVKEAEQQLEKARFGLKHCELKAPADGTILQVFPTAAVGSKFGEQMVKPAFLFYEGGLIVKADLNQEFAHRVKVGMDAVIEEVNSNGQTWKGKVTHVAKSYLPKREATGGLEPLLQGSGELVLECRIAFDPDQTIPPVNLKVRVLMGQ